MRGRLFCPARKGVIYRATAGDSINRIRQSVEKVL